MRIRTSMAGDGEVLFDIWQRAVGATHGFVAADDVAAFTPMVRDYLASGNADLCVLCDDRGAAIGFMGMTGCTIDSLFIAPEHHGRGGGRMLVAHASERFDDLTVDVNEQNKAACRFYEACGFVVEGRSELDSTDRPYPLLHMRRQAQA